MKPIAILSFLVLSVLCGCSSAPSKAGADLRDSLRSAVGKQVAIEGVAYRESKEATTWCLEIAKGVRVRLMDDDGRFIEAGGVYYVNGELGLVSTGKTQQFAIVRGGYRAKRPSVSNPFQVMPDSEITLPSICGNDQDEANQAPLPTPGKCPPSNHDQVPGAADL